MTKEEFDQLNVGDTVKLDLSLIRYGIDPKDNGKTGIICQTNVPYHNKYKRPKRHKILMEDGYAYYVISKIVDIVNCKKINQINQKKGAFLLAALTFMLKKKIRVDSN